MENLDFEITNAILSTRRLLSTQILASPDGIQRWPVEKEIYRMPVFTEIVIHLNFLLWRAFELGYSVSVRDNVIQANGVKDFRGLVRIIRNAACHDSSGHRTWFVGPSIANQKSFFGFIIVKGNLHFLKYLIQSTPMMLPIMQD